MGEWSQWVALAGRGWGKSRVGKEWVREEVNAGARRFALVGATNSDVRNVMIEGSAESPGLLDVFPDHQRPVYIPSKRLIKFHTGAVGYTYSAETPARLRGPQHDRAWCDELAAWEEAGPGRMRHTWDMLKFGLRLGAHPRACITTTPKPLKLLKELLADPGTVITRGRTLDNAANLAPSFLTEIVRLYQGTRLGRQELDAEVLADIEGALWMLETIEAHRVRTAPNDMARIYVGVDPSVAGQDFTEDRSKKRDDCGIVVCGRRGPKRSFAERYVLGDYSMNAAPDKWALEVVRVFWLHQADAVIAEGNNGGELVRMAINHVDPRVKVKMVTATRNKATRAEPVAMAYQRGEVHHVRDAKLQKLEEEMTTWVPDGKSGSPNRVDALVWAIIEDMEGVASYGTMA